MRRRKLDDALIYNLSQVEGYGYSDKVQFTGLVKFSVPYQTGDDAQFQGTRLYSLTPTGMENERIADADYRLDNPDHRLVHQRRGRADARQAVCPRAVEPRLGVHACL